MLWLNLNHVLDHGNKWKCSQSVILQGCSLCYCSYMLNLWIPHTLQKITEDINTQCKIPAYHSNRSSVYHHYRDIVNREILLSVYLKSRYSMFTVLNARCSNVLQPDLIPHAAYFTEIFFVSVMKFSHFESSETT